MRSLFFITLIGALALSGCQGKQARLAQLNAAYKAAHQQYINECIAPHPDGADAYFKGVKPKIASPQEEAAHNRKCAQELKQVTSIEQQVAALSK